MKHTGQSVQIEGNTHYKFGRYVNLIRWNSYWHQIAETMTLKPEKVLIIGAGDNIVTQILKEQGINVYTLDFDEETSPDFAGNITNIDNILQGKHFDVILCCQVLEHIPYGDVENVLNKLKLIADFVIISLPYCAANFKLDVKFPFIKNMRLNIECHRFFEKHKFDGQHYWEVGKKGFSKRQITKDLEKYFVVKKRFTAIHNQYHLFFVLASKQS